MLFLLWLHSFILPGVISPLISRGILGMLWPGEFIFQCPIFLPFHIVHGFSRQEYWNGLPFPSPVVHILSDLSTTTWTFWVATHRMAQFHWIRQDCGSCDQICLMSVIVVSVCLPSDALSQCLPSYLGFSYLQRGVSLNGCSSKVQPLLLALDSRYVLLATTPFLGGGVAPLGGSCTTLPQELAVVANTSKFLEK